MKNESYVYRLLKGLKYTFPKVEGVLFSLDCKCEALLSLILYPEHKSNINAGGYMKSMHIKHCNCTPYLQACLEFHGINPTDARLDIKLRVS